MDGVYVNYQRPKTKKALKEAVKAAPETVSLESTSMFGGYSGPVTEMPDGEEAYVVGPDPYTKRNWYATVSRAGDKVTVS